MAVEKKKEKKLQAIQKAAYELFIDKGIDNTTIDDIVKGAGIAKGTFYLYFKDKRDLIEEIVLKKTGSILDEALSSIEEEHSSNKDKMQQLIVVLEYIIDFFTENVEFLSIIYKNLSVGLYHYAELTERPILLKAANCFVQGVGGDIKTAERKLYMIIELVGSVCYNAIVLSIPCTMEEIKPDLFHAVRRIVADE